MTFPVYFELGPLRLHPHLVLEAIAYAVGLYLTLLRKPKRQAPPQQNSPTLSSTQVVTAEITPSQRSSVSVGALAGALLGAKLLVLFQHVNVLGQDWRMFALLALQGKTIVGALLGGLVGVEVTKKMIGLRQSTGDSFVFSVLLGMMIGRVGCFLTGLSDRTYGIATTLPWGIDFGDGIPRHPTQLYEVGFLLLLLIGLCTQKDRMPRDGDLFKTFMIAYLGFRLLVDFIKPEFRPLLGLSAIQIACVCGLIYYWRDGLRLSQAALSSRRRR